MNQSCYIEGLENRQLWAAFTTATQYFQLEASCFLVGGFTLTNPSTVHLSGGDWQGNQVINPAIIFSSPIDTSAPPFFIRFGEFEYKARINLALKDCEGTILGQCTLSGQSGLGDGLSGTIPPEMGSFVQSVGVPIVTHLEAIHTSTLTFDHGPYVRLHAPYAALTFYQDNVACTAQISFSIGLGAQLILEKNGHIMTAFPFADDAVTSGMKGIFNPNIAFGLLEPDGKQKFMDFVEAFMPLGE